MRLARLSEVATVAVVTAYKNTPDVAKLYGISRRRINRIAQVRGITPSLPGRPAYWSESEILALKPGKPGRPKKGAKP